MRQIIKKIWKICWERKKISGQLDGKGIDEADLIADAIEKYQILRTVKTTNPELAGVFKKMAAQIMDVWLTLDDNDPNYDRKERKLKGEAHVLITLLQEIENAEYLLGVANKELEKLQDQRKTGGVGR